MSATCLACTGRLPHPGCSGFEGGYDTHHCVCYMQTADANPLAHPNTYAAELARKLERCKAEGTHYPVSLGFGDYKCGACGCVGRSEAS